MGKLVVLHVLPSWGERGERVWERSVRGDMEGEG